MQKLEVRGKKYDIALTMGAFSEISAICPGGDFSRIGELLSGGTGAAMEASAKMLAAMSRGSEEQKRFEDPDYKPSPLSFEALRTLPVSEYTRIFGSFHTILSRAMKGQTVEAEPSKKKEKEETE